LKIQINGRHLDVTDAIREYVEDRGSRLFRFFDRIQKVQFVLSTQGVRYTAEVVVSAPKGGRLVAEATEESLQAAVDKVTDRMERQINRYKEKLRGHRWDAGRQGLGESLAGSASAVSEEDEE
jgi:putative sigma-54 modulation protein